MARTATATNVRDMDTVSWESGGRRDTRADLYIFALSRWLECNGDGPLLKCDFCQRMVYRGLGVLVTRPPWLSRLLMHRSSQQLATRILYSLFRPLTASLYNHLQDEGCRCRSGAAGRRWVHDLVDHSIPQAPTLAGPLCMQQKGQPEPDHPRRSFFCSFHRRCLCTGSRFQGQRNVSGVDGRAWAEVAVMVVCWL